MSERLYDDRRARFQAERDLVDGRLHRVANARLVVFVLAFVVLLAAFDFAGARVLLFLSATVLLGGFTALVVVSRRAQRELRRLEAMVLVNEEAAARVDREWDRLPLVHDATPVAEDHPYAEDLDLLGRASLFQLLGTARTVPGRDTLTTWLLTPARPDEVVLRQQAVAELIPRLEFRQEYEAKGLDAGHVSSSRLEGFLKWAESLGTPVHPPWLVPWCRVLGPVLGATAVWLFVAWLGGNTLGALWIVPILVNAMPVYAYHERIHATFDVLAASEGAFVRYGEMLSMLEAQRFTCDELRRIDATVREEGVAAHEALRRLHRLIHLSEVRRSSASGLFQVLLLWDFHVVAGLERWRSRSGRRAREWLKSLGEVEALSALAGLAHDNPEWGFPEIRSEPSAGIEGTDVGHPLLRGDKRVVNDIEIGPAHTFLLVTGSNMSGKSTLLRALGLNVVMAQAGGVVCASRFRMPTVRLFTSMRIRDSIEHGVSYFMAGLMRLRSIVTAARTHRVDDAAFLYLLDEVLQGTNSAERHVAVCRIVGELIALDTMGAVTTHDLALADAEELQQACRPPTRCGSWSSWGSITVEPEGQEEYKGDGHHDRKALECRSFVDTRPGRFRNFHTPDSGPAWEQACQYQPSQFINRAGALTSRVRWTATSRIRHSTIE